MVGQRYVDIAGDRRRAVADGDCLIVGDHDDHLDAEIVSTRVRL
jgi:hypothetical protein